MKLQHILEAKTLSRDPAKAPLKNIYFYEFGGWETGTDEDDDRDTNWHDGDWLIEDGPTRDLFILHAEEDEDPDGDEGRAMLDTWEMLYRDWYHAVGTIPALEYVMDKWHSWPFDHPVAKRKYYFIGDQVKNVGQLQKILKDYRVKNPDEVIHHLIRHADTESY